MLTRIPIFLRTSWEQIRRATITRFPDLISGAELARSSWAKTIQSYEGVPDLYKKFFAPFAENEKTFPYTVLTPSHERFIHRQTEKLICLLNDELFVLENIGSTFEVQCYPFDGINYVEFRSALLSSSIKVCGRTSSGVQTSSTLNFNSVTDYLFVPILKRARLGVPDSRDTDNQMKTEQFSHLAKVNFKFMNYARHSLYNGQKVIYSIFQSEILENTFSMLGKTYSRTISPAHMIILTDSELILIREDTVRRKEDRYGGIWTYIPLNKIMSLAVSENAEHLLLALTIRLIDKTCFELLFQPTASLEINQISERFTLLTAERL